MKIFSSSIAVLLLVAAFPALASAADIRLMGTSTAIHVGDTFTVDVSLDTGRDAINALEGSIHIPSQLKLREIRLFSSVVPLWVTAPKETTPGVVTFAGILPGGYENTGIQTQPELRGNVYTLVLEAMVQGAANITFGIDTKVYQNDGKGTPVSLSAHSLSLPVHPAGAAPITAAVPSDVTAPEPFKAVVVSAEPFGHAGQALVFTTEDKNSGIASYEIATSYSSRANQNLSWRKVESPYFLNNDDTDKYIFVRALDVSNNARIATVAPLRKSFASFMHEWWMVMLGILLGVILIFHLQKRRAW